MLLMTIMKDRNHVIAVAGDPGDAALPGDVASFMARQPANRAHLVNQPLPAAQPDGVDFESPSSSSGSTYASDVQSHFFHIFSLFQPMTAARTRTDTWAAMRSNIRYVLNLHRHDIQAIQWLTTGLLTFVHPVHS